MILIINKTIVCGALLLRHKDGDGMESRQLQFIERTTRRCPEPWVLGGDGFSLTKIV